MSRARVKLTETSASQIAEQMQTDPEYARMAVAKYGYKILRERINIDQISGVAAEELKPDPPYASNDNEQEAPPISEDWLNAFEEEAAKISSDQMQRMFGRILAGEIRKPASYSIKSVKLMSQLDNRAAILFKQLCSISASLRAIGPSGETLIDDVRVISMGNAGSNSLQAYGLSFDALNILQEYGLVISDYNSYMTYAAAIARNGKVALPITYQNKPWAFVPKDANKEFRDFRVHGVALSRSGREVLSIVDIQPNEAYTIALMKFFETQGVTMTPVATAPHDSTVD